MLEEVANSGSLPSASERTADLRRIRHRAGRAGCDYSERAASGREGRIGKRDLINITSVERDAFQMLKALESVSFCVTVKINPLLCRGRTDL